MVEETNKTLKSILDRMNVIIEILQERREKISFKELPVLEIEKTIVKEDYIHKKPKTYTIDSAKQYQVADKSCKFCGGKVSWELYPQRKGPLHVDDNGYIIGDGGCPEYGK